MSLPVRHAPIESWFDVKVEGALSAGVNLARVSLDPLATDMAAKTRNASAQVAQVPDAAAGLVLERIRDQLGATDVVLWNASGQAVASAGHRGSASTRAARRGLACAQRASSAPPRRSKGWTTLPTRLPRRTQGSRCWLWSAAPA